MASTTEITTPTQPVRHPQRPGLVLFLARSLAWIVGLFALVRIPWVQDHLLIPFARLQHGAACSLTGAPRDALVVDLSCTGADVMAVTLGALLSFPLAWKRRWTGAGLALALLIGLNTARIGSLSWVASNRDLFDLLHLRLFPLLLVLAATTFVLYWIRKPAASISSKPIAREVAGPMAWVVSATIVYFALAPTLYSSDLILQWAFWITAASAQVMNWLGVEARINGNLLTTPHGRWLVTQECVLTPLIPAYLGLVWALVKSNLNKIFATLAAFLLFSALGASRLLVLALPTGLMGTQHYTALHAFYQIILAVLVVFAINRVRRQRGAATYLGPGWAITISASLGTLIQIWDRGRIGTSSDLAIGDPQGVLSFLPAYMVGLLVALTLVVGGRSLITTAVASVGLVATGLGLRILLGNLATDGFVLHPLVLRTIGIALPTLLAWGLRRRQSTTDYLDQWIQVGEWFPDLGQAASTQIYRRDEQRLLGEFFPSPKGLTILKTDLWDEARNTRILQWLAGQGATVHGIDISLPTVIMARNEFRRLGVKANLLVADVRAIPYRDRCFDGVYSMGTVEHFPETQKAVREIGRVTDSNGKVVLGVPNARDPFLRPVLVGALQAFGLYHYGDEKSYSHSELGRICQAAGLQVEARNGILLQPGWLRMMDLALHTEKVKIPALPSLVRWLLIPFSAAYDRLPWLRSHGYLIAAIARPKSQP